MLMYINYIYVCIFSTICGICTYVGHYIHTILGPLGEELHLLSLIPLGRYKPKEWLPTLDRAIRTSLACLLTICSESFPAELDSYSPLENKDTAIDMTGKGTFRRYYCRCTCHIMNRNRQADVRI